MLDAVVVGGGPSGLGAALALSGWRPHYVPGCAIVDEALARRLSSHTGVIAGDDVRRLSKRLRGRSHHPPALLFDALQHPGVDLGFGRQPSCLELRRDPTAALDFKLVDPLPLGGGWHAMHDATRTLSPGFWMELPGYSLSAHLDAGKSADARQPRSTVAAYYEAAGRHFGLDEHHSTVRVAAVRWHPAAGNGDGEAASGETASAGHWSIDTLADGASSNASAGPLLARNLILAVGTYGVPRRLGIDGEGLPFVSHRCTEPPTTSTEPPTTSSAAEAAGGAGESADRPHRAPTVLVVGAGLSAADCIVHHLISGRRVLHAFRGDAFSTKLGSKFGGEGAARLYPEYYELVHAMASDDTSASASTDNAVAICSGADEAAATAAAAGSSSGSSSPSAAAATAVTSSYEPLAFTELRRIGPDGECDLLTTVPPAAAEGEARGEGEEGGGGSRRRAVRRVDAVSILIGSSPDLSFLPEDVMQRLEARGPPPQELDGVASTHPIFVEVDTWSGETKAVPQLFACGPLRGDNFARFAIHDGYGVADAIRARKQTCRASE